MKFFAYAVGALALAAVVAADKDKDELIKDASKLRGEAAGAIEKLKKEGKGFLAHEIEVLEHEVEEIEKKIHVFTPHTSVGQIGLHAAETVLHSIEDKLKHKIADLNKSFDTTKEELAKDAAKLKGEAAGAIALLKSQGKTVLAHEIEVLEHEVEEIEHKLENLHPHTSIGQIGLHAAQNILHGLEERLKHKIDDLTHHFDTTKDKDALAKDAEKLKQEAHDAAEKLKKGGKGFLAHEIEVLEHEVEEIEKKIHNLHPTTSIGQVGLHAAETVLHSIEERLKNKIHDLEKTFDSKDKDDLKKDAEKLKGETRAEIDKLKKEGKETVAKELEILEAEVEKVEKIIEHAHPQTEVGKIAIHAAEHVLQGLEKKLQDKIKALHH